MRILPTGFIAPFPTKAPRPPTAGDWLHEIKHDGFRIIARKAGTRVRLYSRPGNDLTARFPLIVEALALLKSRSCIIDGEAVACGDDGVASFDLLRHRRQDHRVFLYAFDLLDRRAAPLGAACLKWCPWARRTVCRTLKSPHPRCGKSSTPWRACRSW